MTIAESGEHFYGLSTCTDFNTWSLVLSRQAAILSVREIGIAGLRTGKTFKIAGPTRGSRNGRPIVRNAILALSDKWLSLDTRPMDEQMIIAQMSFINIGQVHIWFRTSADAMLLVRRTSASQISCQPLPTSQLQVFAVVAYDVFTKYHQSSRTCKYIILTVHPFYCQPGAKDLQFSCKLHSGNMKKPQGPLLLTWINSLCANL